jgi:hypothetical protein
VVLGSVVRGVLGVSYARVIKPDGPSYNILLF